MLMMLYEHLPKNVATYRSRRAPGREDDYFVFEVALSDNDRLHHFGFYIDDRTASGTLFVDGLMHITDSLEP